MYKYLRKAIHALYKQPLLYFFFEFYSKSQSQMLLCRNDLSEGIRASARMIVGAERGIKEGISLAGRTVTDQVLPAVKKSAPKALG